MELEVDRLLAQLNTGSQPRADRNSPLRDASDLPPRSSPTVTASGNPPTRGNLLDLWSRVLLGAALGGAMTQWPYRHECGIALVGYLGAVAMVLLTGGWLAWLTWRFRNGLTHILAFILIFWGIVLMAEQVLPRIGYAAERATWGCVVPAEP